MCSSDLPTVPGLAIHQLSRREGIDAIHITRWEWDGRARSRVDAAVRASRPDGDGDGGDGGDGDDGDGRPEGMEPLW